MPKIYQFKGFDFFFYSNEHDPPHCHIKKDSVEIRVKFYENESDEYVYVTNKKFSPSQLRDIQEFVNAHRNKILTKWNTYFILNKKAKFEIVNTIKRSNK